jgi:hypothetical protein
MGVDEKTAKDALKSKNFKASFLLEKITSQYYSISPLRSYEMSSNSVR